MIFPQGSGVMGSFKKVHIKFEWIPYFFSPLQLYGLVVTVAAVTVSYHAFDLPIARFCRQFQETSIERFFQYITVGGDSLPYIVVSAAGYVLFQYYLHHQKNAEKFLLLFQSVVISGIVADIIKWVAGRYRPIEYFDHHLYGFDFFHINAESISFPSGHTTTAFAMAMTLTHLFPKFQWIWWSAAILVGISRIILRAHYLSDVIFGAFLGTVTVLWIVSNRNNKGPSQVDTGVQRDAVR